MAKKNKPTYEFMNYPNQPPVDWKKDPEMRKFYTAKVSAMTIEDLINWRNRMGWTQYEAAKWLLYTVDYYRHLENGRSKISKQVKLITELLEERKQFLKILEKGFDEEPVSDALEQNQ